ncbi:MAG: methionine biosynthesis protein MetW [Alphaproteobacteria bacterium]
MPVTAKKPLQPANKPALRADLQMLCDFIPEGAKVLDVGCGDGSLLESLIIEKNAQGFGLEISREGVEKALARGLSVIQGDAETDLVTYANQSFDVVVLSKALQSLKNPAMVLAELARIGKTVLVSFSNYGHWRVRLQGWLAGRVPILEGESGKDDGWWNAPHIRPCSLTDFLMLLEHSGLYCQQVGLLSQKKTTFITADNLPNFVFKRQIERANAFTKQAVFEVKSSP